MNPLIDDLRSYPFTKLAKLTAGVTPSERLSPIAMYIGEPRHPAPDFVADILGRAQGLSSYPSSLGLPELRNSCANALVRRFNVPDNFLNPDSMIVPVNGTREALFSFVQAVVGRKKNPIVAMPNPFYQIYEGAALLAGAEPWYLNATADNGFMPDLENVPDEIWSRCEILFLCTPGNPTGEVADKNYLRQALKLADQFDFIVAVDECYTDLYRADKPPAGLLEVCHEDQRLDLNRCAMFFSLSKRSSVPGLRSGFVVAAPDIVVPYRLYRTYHGCTMTEFVQKASIELWNDDSIARENRRLYDEKFTQVTAALKDIWPQHIPPGAFYLWAETPGDDCQFTKALFAHQNVKVLPGQYLAREVHNVNPGFGRVRISLVPGIDECLEAADRMATFIKSHG